MGRVVIEAFGGGSVEGAAVEGAAVEEGVVGRVALLLSAVETLVCPRTTSRLNLLILPPKIQILDREAAVFHPNPYITNSTQ
jgi:hypothetical protein